MATRVGIELSAAACRIVEIDGAGSTGGRPLETRVRSYAVLPFGGAEMSARLVGLRQSEAAVIVWGMRGVHHPAEVSGGYDRMRSEALASARQAGIPTDGMLADIAAADPRNTGAGRRSVMAAMAAADQVSLALRPIIDAGLRVRSVTTPAGALASLARLRTDRSTPELVEAYVALEETATAVALVRDRALIAARELRWGYMDDGAAMPQPRRREDIAARLVVDLAALGATSGLKLSSMGQIAICGGLSDLRSMTTSIMEVVDAEVEPLDAMFGIDEVRLPEPADDFRERSAELRLAWAVAADWPGPINLMRHRQRRARRTALARAAVVAGVGLGIGAGWLIQRGPWWQTTFDTARPALLRAVTRATPPPPATVAPASPALRVAPAAPALAPPTPPPSATPPPAQTQPTPTSTPPTATPAPRPSAIPAPVPVPAPTAAPPMQSPPSDPTKPVTTAPPAVAPRPALPPPAAAVPKAVQLPQPAPVPPTAQTPVARSSPTRPMPEPEPAPTPQPRVAVSRPQILQGLSGRERPEAPPTPFDAVLGSILYSPDRKLALIDGRIVGSGDEVKGARVVDITPGGVTLRDSQGRLRTLVLAAPGK